MAENIEQIGKKMRVQQDYVDTRKVPLETERTKTNFPYIVLMGIYLVFWLGIAIYAVFPANFKVFFDWGRQVNEEISEARNIIIQFSAFTAFMSLGYIILLRRFSRVLVFATVFIFGLLLLAAVCIFLFFCITQHNYEAYLAGLIISSFMLISTIISVIVLRKELQIATEAIRVSSEIVFSFGSCLVFPILPCFLYAIVMIFSERTLYHLTDYSFRLKDYVMFFHLINIFGFLWLMLFITGWSQAVLSGCFCTWYWTKNKHFVTNYRTISSFILIIVRYHLGTIACGSLMIILHKLMRFLLNTFGKLYVLLDILLGYKVLFIKLETFFTYVNCNAYIMTSSHGTEFFKSGRNASNLVLKYISDTIIVPRVAEAILILAQILIIIISASITYGYCQWSNGTDDLTPTAVLLVMVSGMLITASIFMVLKVAINSTLLCSLEECEKNNAEESTFISKVFKAPFLKT